MTPDNTYHRRGHDECRACNREQKSASLARRQAAAGTRRCDCGCGTLIPGITSHGTPARYAGGHHHRGKSNTWLIKDEVTVRTSHSRALKIKQLVAACEWAHIGGCLGHLQVAHVNGDERDNSSGNLLKLCQAHHRLLDNGRIDPAAPVMPAFITGSDGKRRYAYAYRWVQARIEAAP